VPELPEVETIRRSLYPAVVGRTIGSVEIMTRGVFLPGSMPVTGWRISDLTRRGKYLIFVLEQTGQQGGEQATQQAGDQEARLVVHLRMTGRLLLKTSAEPPARHTHVRLRLEPAAAASPVDRVTVWLDFQDTRRFGRLWLLPPANVSLTDADHASAASQTGPLGLGQLGPEPLDPSFDGPLLASRLRRHPQTRLKAALLDQSVVAGLGNIYADEAAFAAGLHPARRVGTLSTSETSGLAKAISQVIIKAIDCQGTSLRDYVDGWNRKGTFQDCLMVYGRAGQPCRNCGTIIEKMRLQGRTTCWCPSCQPEILPETRAKTGEAS
jgi:formamidopyrimidine-DNA glycosylase